MVSGEKRDTFVGKLSLLGDEWSPLRALSACGQILHKNPGKGQTPPHSGNAWILGVSIPDTPPLLKYIAQWIRFQCVCVQRMTWQWRWFTLIEVGRSGRKKSWNVNRFHSEKPLSTHKVGKKSWKVYFTLSPQYTKEQKLGRPYYYTTIWLPLFNLSYGI